MMQRREWLLLAIALGLTACSDPTELALRGGVAVSFATRNPAVSPAPAFDLAAALDDTTVVGADTLIITSAQVVFREIEIKAAETADCDVEPEPAGCEEIAVGPHLVDLPLTLGAEQEFSLDIPAGEYTRIDFEVHKLSDGDPSDAAFLAQHPEFADLSIRVQGTFNGTAFSFESDLDVEQELELLPSLTVVEDATVNVTVRVDVGTWFRLSGGSLIDPATANKGGPNESEVKQTIKDSFHAFEDDDRDGDGTN